jgi:sulfatase modifying factor 1
MSGPPSAGRASPACCAPSRANADTDTVDADTVDTDAVDTDAVGAGPVALALMPPAARIRSPGYDTRVALPGGTFRMGTEDADANPGDREGPVREVAVDAFAIDAYAVTTARFAAFVEDTGHRTEAERHGWSFVFARFLPGDLRRVSPRPDATPWWCGVEGAGRDDRI